MVVSFHLSRFSQICIVSPEKEDSNNQKPGTLGKKEPHFSGRPLESLEGQELHRENRNGQCSWVEDDCNIVEWNGAIFAARTKIAIETWATSRLKMLTCSHPMSKQHILCVADFWRRFSGSFCIHGLPDPTLEEVVPTCPSCNPYIYWLHQWPKDC